MVESTNSEEDRLEGEDGPDTATIDPQESSDAEAADATIDAATSADSDPSEGSEKDEAELSPLPPPGPGFWKQYRLAMGLVLLLVLVLVACSQARWYMNWQAQYALEHRDHAAAIWWLQTSKRVHPSDHWKTEFLLARIFRRQNRLELMEEHLRRAHQLPGADILLLDREQMLAQAQNGQINQIGGDKVLQRLLINHRGDAAEIASAFVTVYLRKS